MSIIRKLLLFFVLLLIPIAAAEQVDNYQDYGSLEIDVKEEASIIAEKEFIRDAIRIDEFTAEVSFFPQGSFNQIILSQVPYGDPEAITKTEDELITIQWKDIRAGKFKYFIDSKVKTINKFPIIRYYTRFPYHDYEDEAMEYLEPTETICITGDIRRQATDIIQGQTDYYRVVFKLADWVQKNINYSLTTLTEDTVLNSSWVLKNREGVCDELTTLYIAFLRSVGIPARFASGQVYSNKNYKFGEHGWAEVFFPEIGWIPVDVTFMQYGWISPGHIKFKHSLDSAEPSVRHTWKTIGTDLTINPLYIVSQVSKTLGKAENHVEVEVSALRDKAGPNSTIPIKVTVRNLKDYYVPLIVQISKSPAILGDNRKAVLLEPKEERTLFWIAEMPSDLEEGYLYKTTIEAKSTFGNNASTIIELARGYETYGLNWAEERVDRLSPREGKSFLPDLEFQCNYDKEHYYREEAAVLSCTISNIGNTNFNLVKICHETNCRDVELLISEKKEAEWQIEVAELKDPELKITAESKNLMRYSYPTMKIIEKPEIVIYDFEPKTIDYKNESELIFFLSSNSTAYDVKLDIDNYGYSTVSQVLEEKALAFPFKPKTFKRGTIKVTLEYHDEIGNAYSSEHNYNIEVTSLPWHTRLLLWIEKLLS